MLSLKWRCGDRVLAMSALERLPAFLDRSAAQIFAIKMHQVESEEYQPSGMQPHRRPQRFEVGDTPVALHSNLTVDDRRIAAELPCGIDYRSILVGPIQPLRVKARVPGYPR